MYYVYILTNKNNTVLYTGVTNDLLRRLEEHKNHIDKGSFSARYQTEKLVYYEAITNIEAAIQREKQIKGGSRAKKIELINSINPTWNDLSKEFE